MTTERYELTWREFDQSASQAFKQQYNNQDYSDVTLACEADRQIKAHKMILSACSPFFQKILKLNPHPNTLIYLKGVKYESLQLILRFMYLGETKVAEAELQSFLDAAEELKVLGLSDASKFKRDLGLSTGNTQPQPFQETQTYQEPKIETAHLDSSNSNFYLNPTAAAEPGFVYVQVDESQSQYPVTTTTSLPMRRASSSSSSSLQSQSRARPILKKDATTVRCNLCKMLLVNDEKSLLDHVQRMHGA